MAVKKQVTEISLNELAAEDAFQSWGYAYLKVTKGESAMRVKVRIRSVPQEVIDEIRKKAPKPPAHTVMLDPSSEEGRRLGVTTRQKATVPNFSDAKYQEELEAHNLLFTQKVVGMGVDETLSLRDGSAAVHPEQKYKALQEKGLSGSHMVELSQSILKLTDWSEQEREDFFESP